MHWYGKIFPYDNAIHERNFLTITFGRWTLISKVTLELSPKISAKIWKLYAKQRNKKSLQYLLPFQVVQEDGVKTTSFEEI